MCCCGCSIAVALQLRALEARTNVDAEAAPQTDRLVAPDQGGAPTSEAILWKLVRRWIGLPTCVVLAKAEATR